MQLQYGDDSSGKKCGGLCPEPLAGDLVFRDGTYYHRNCLEKKEKEDDIRRANNVMRRFGFEPMTRST